MLIVLMHVAIQLVYCYYMLAPSVNCLWNIYLKVNNFVSVERTNKQKKSYGVEDKCSMVQ